MSTNENVTPTPETEPNAAVKALMMQQQNEVAMQQDVPLGFEDLNNEDVIIPRIKIIQALSPERKAKEADEGDLLNSLTKEQLNGKTFVPVFMFKPNICWIDRDLGGGIECRSFDGRIGIENETGKQLACVNCRRNEFDNSKQGKEAQPECTKYMDFFGFIEGTRAPIVLSFSKTCYNEGRAMVSLAKTTMQNMWNYGYKIDTKEMTKNDNSWYIVKATMGLQTSDEDRAFGMMLYKSFKSRTDILSKVDTTQDGPIVDDTPADASEY